MKIISKYTDYYDSVQGVMYDDEIKYIRKKIIHKLNLSFSSISLKPHCELIIVGFCGKLYPMIRVSNISSCVNVAIANWIIKNNKKLLKLPKDVYPNTYISNNFKEIIPVVCDRFSRIGLDRNNINKKINIILKDVKELESLNLFQKYQTPIFVIRYSRKFRTLILETGSELKYCNFQKIMDPYTTYQELVMWIGNQAVTSYPPQIVDDIVLRDSKGFDNWSFKNKPGFKKKRGK